MLSPLLMSLPALLSLPVQAATPSPEAKAQARSYELASVFGVPPVAALAWAPDGATLYAAGTDDILRILEVHDLSQRSAHEHQGVLLSQVTVSPDGSQVLVGDDDGNLTLRDAVTGELQARWLGTGRPSVGVAWAPDDSAVAAVALHGPLRMLNPTTGRPEDSAGGPAEWFGKAAFSWSGDRAAVTGDEGAIRVFELSRRTTVMTLEGEGPQNRELELSPDGRWLAAINEEGQLSLWDMHGKQDVVQRQVPTGVGMTFTADSKQLILPDADGQPALMRLSWTHRDHTLLVPPIWTGLPLEDDAEEQARDRRSWRPDLYAGSNAVLSPDGGRLAEAWGDELRVWDLSSGALLARRPVGLDAVTSLAFQPDEDLLAIATRTGQVQVREPVDGAIRAVLALPRSPARDVEFSKDGRWLAVAGPDDHVRVWEMLEGSPVPTLFGHEGPVLDVGFSKRGRLMSASADGTLGRWDIKRRQRTGKYTVSEQPLEEMALSPRAEVVAVWPAAPPKAEDSDPNAPALDDAPPSPALFTTSGVPRGLSWEGQHPNGTGAWSPNGKVLLSAGKKLEFIDTHSGGAMDRVAAAGDYRALAWSPSGLLIAGGVSDGSLKLLDIETGHRLRSLSGHTGPVLAVAFSADGTLLATGSEDGTVRVWTLR